MLLFIFISNNFLDFRDVHFGDVHNSLSLPAVEGFPSSFLHNSAGAPE